MNHLRWFSLVAIAIKLERSQTIGSSHIPFQSEPLHSTQSLHCCNLNCSILARKFRRKNLPSAIWFLNVFVVAVKFVSLLLLLFMFRISLVISDAATLCAMSAPLSVSYLAQKSRESKVKLTPYTKVKRVKSQSGRCKHRCLFCFWRRMINYLAFKWKW